ncbi:lysophospholipid acyltransferase family protein [Mailhella massiliensis]|uniref:Lysophospholipid acyltransferase family protein n=1 Tax=Mailhella massiliensis TaxID=1903261 RepID=A0A921AUF6_9BACT|nr:lysophospholipid acyltransferase family protein [Mailhella massiliensis]HJD96044.1 lysophospholipid acyltransferase family protein [Mailhella massiliensis]
MTGSERFRLALLRAAGSFLRLLGFPGIALLGNGVGHLIWYLVPSRRRLAVNNIMRHLGMTEKEAEKTAHASFCHTGRSFLEILLTGSFGMRSPRLRIESPELMERLRACERPIVAATAHFGSWELLASMLGQLYAPPRPRMVVVRRYHDEAVQSFIASCREATGADMVGHRNAAMSVIRALHHKGIVAFLVDHNTSPAEAEFLPFLDEVAAVNMGPALLAVRAKALIWPVALVRDGENYVFRQQEPLDTTILAGSRDEQVKAAAAFYTRAIERFIRDNPEQWFWMHNRWKTRELPGT